MKKFTRKEERFDEIGRVESDLICALPGVLDDISFSGCRVHFPNPVNVDMENDYELNVKFANKDLTNNLKLLAHPQWISEDESETAVGFKILISPDTPQLKACIDALRSAQYDESDINNMLIGSSANIIK